MDPYTLPAGPTTTTADPPHAAAAVDRWDRQTDARTPNRYVYPAAYYASSVNYVNGGTKWCILEQLSCKYWQIKNKL